MTEIAIAEPRVNRATSHEVLTSRLGAEEYGIDVLAVQEIRRYEAPTRILNAASHWLGVMNLRGVMVPIMNLRRRLGLIKPRPKFNDRFNAGFIVGLAPQNATGLPGLLQMFDVTALVCDR